MRIAQVAAEFGGLVQTGGLADAVAALSKHLAWRGHELRVFVPLYGQVDSADLDLRPVMDVQEVVVPLGDGHYTASACSCALSGHDAEIYFIDCPEAYGRTTVYDNAGDEHLRFALLARMALESCQRLGWSPDIFHCHDWHAAMLPLYLRTIYAWDEQLVDCRTALTIHNLAYQGSFSAELAADLGIPQPHQPLLGPDGSLNFLAAGIRHADWVTTVSPSYAAEILEQEHGAGLERLLRSRADRLVGILNGVDDEVWNPETDRLIPARYSAEDLSGKSLCRAALLEEAGLASRPAGPVLGIVSRLAGQKGLDLVGAVIPHFLSREDIRLIVLGTGEDRLEAMFREIAQLYPDRAAYVSAFDEALAHRIEAGSDLFLMPSRFEPCGLNQMYSLRYGTPPVVHRVGGLADTVEPFDEASGEGTGFVFSPFGAEGLSRALDEALAIFGRPDSWRKLVLNGMAKDFTWPRQAAAYESVYERLLAAPPASVASLEETS